MTTNKKPTYQELEKENEQLKDNKVDLIIFLVIFVILSSILFALHNNLQSENEQLKSQLNSTEGKNYSCDFVGAIKPEDNRVCEGDNKIMICEDCGKERTFNGFIERDGERIFVCDGCLKEEKDLKTMKINN